MALGDAVPTSPSSVRPHPAELGKCCRDQGCSQASPGQQGPDYIGAEPLPMSCSSPSPCSARSSLSTESPDAPAVGRAGVQQQDPHTARSCGVLLTPWGHHAALTQIAGASRMAHCRAWHFFSPPRGPV